MTHLDSDIAVRNTIESQINAYHHAKELIEQGYGILAQAEKLLEGAFGEHYRDFDTVDGHYHDEATKNILDKIKVSAWNRFVDLLEIRKTLSVKRAEELDRKLDNAKELPEITLQNVFDTLLTLTQNSRQFAEEAIREVYDDLRPRSTKYVTNQKNASEHIGRKIICTHTLESNYRGGFSISYYRNQPLVALDNVFHILDGKVMRDGYQSPLIDAIQTSGSEGKGETDYFKFKCYRNGNLHIEFKRLDLLKIFNAVAGGANLPSGNL